MSGRPLLLRLLLLPLLLLLPIGIVAAPAPASAESFGAWAARAQGRVEGAALPAEVSAELAALAAQAVNRPSATVAWVMPAVQGPAEPAGKVKKRVKRPKSKPQAAPRDYLVLATTSSAATGKRGALSGLLLLIRPTGGGIVLKAHRPVPAPAESRWRWLTATDVDGDREPDAILEWTQASRNFTRRGMVVARTRPPALALIELASETNTGRGTRIVEPKTACFFPVSGLGKKALIVQRRETTTVDGIQRQLDAMELFVPGGDGQLVDGHVFGAMYAGDGQERDVLRRWGKVFEVRQPEQALTRQSLPGDCPAPGVVLPQRALGQSASPHPLAIVGPFATTSMGVREALKAMGPRGPRAAVVIGIGSL